MRAGIAVDQNGKTWTWMWCDPTCPCPFEIPAEAGLKIVDLSVLDLEEARGLLDAYLQKKISAEIFLASFPVIEPQTPPTPAQGWENRIQVGYRRVCHRPSDDWHARELAARVKANARIAAGKSADLVIEEEFEHLGVEERTLRKEMRRPGPGHADVPFPITPIVRLIERKVKLADGTERVETLRQFPFHEPVAEF